MTGNRPIDPKPITAHDAGGPIVSHPTNMGGDTPSGSACSHSPAPPHDLHPAACHIPGAGGPGVGDPSMSVLASGTAAALGFNTTSTGEITNQLVHQPGVTVDYGEVLFTATASSPVGGPLAAVTGANLNVQGADYVIEFVNNSDGHNANSTWSQSDLQFVAIDITGWQPPNGQTIVEVVDPSATHTWQPGSFLNGNLASLTANAQALGPDTSTSTLAQTMTAQHFMSVASGYAFTAG